jgi:OOP family OmpA-OmpF porin
MRFYLLLTCILCASVEVAAEIPEVFFGVRGGYQWAHDSTYKHSTPNNSIINVYGGLQLSPSWSWDGGYQHYSDLNAKATSITVKTRLFDSALRYDWQLQEDFFLYGRLGAAFWDMDKTHHTFEKLQASGISPFGEVGVAYRFTPNLQVSTGYRYINAIGTSATGQYDNNALLIGLIYSLNQPRRTLMVPSTASTTTRPEKILDEQDITTSLKTVRVLFGFDSMVISPGFLHELANVVEVLNSNSQARVIVEGHTDSRGTAPYNQLLSERRAQIVTHKLIELGASASQIEMQGKGEVSPVADNRTAEGRTQNRRVDLKYPFLPLSR